MKKVLQWIENKADVMAYEASERRWLGNSFAAGAVALVASLFLPVTPFLGLGIMVCPILTYGVAKTVGSACRAVLPRPC
jgi:hypothetical protein